MHLHEFALGACDAHHGFASRQLPQRVRIERLVRAVELGRQHDRVLVANAKYDKGGDIAHHRGARLLAQARHELCRHGEREPVLSGFGEDLRDHLGAEELHFIDDDMKRRSRLWRKGCARHARGLDAGKQERAHQV